MQEPYEPGTNYWPVFSTIKSRADALRATKNTSLFLCVLAGAYTAEFIKTQNYVAAGHELPRVTFVLMGLHIALFGLGGLLLRRFPSRIIAVLLLVVCFLTAIEAAEWILNGHIQKLFTFDTALQLLALWGSARAVEATFKLHGRFSRDAAQTKATSQ